MEWSFTNPKVPSADGNVDACCIFTESDDNWKGGNCAGIKYVGSFAPQPEKWAVWFTKDEYDNFTGSKGFGDTVFDDKANWRTTDTSFTVQFKLARWLPKQERAIEYYVNEFRYESGQTITAFWLKNTADQSW